MSTTGLGVRPRRSNTVGPFREEGDSGPETSEPMQVLWSSHNGAPVFPEAFRSVGSDSSKAPSLLLEQHRAAQISCRQDQLLLDAAAGADKEAARHACRSDEIGIRDFTLHDAILQHTKERESQERSPETTDLRAMEFCGICGVRARFDCPTEGSRFHQTIPNNIAFPVLRAVKPQLRSLLEAFFGRLKGEPEPMQVWLLDGGFLGLDREVNACGLTITHVTSRFRWLRTIPYTVSLLLLVMYFKLVGVCLGFLDVKTSGGLGTLSQSLSLWVTIEPRTSHAILNQGWDHFECAAFGSILAATDPVAVVGLLKEMGASRVLTMQIAGESLLNDGTAIVVWLVFYNLMKGEGEEANAEIVVSFIRLALGGVVFGAACGLIGARWMSLASNRLVHSDSLVQVSLTLAVAYISFFAGENELKLSGVLATIFAALMVGKYAQPLVCDKDALAAVWHLLEFFGNTVLFVLCGVFAFESAQIVRWSDYGWLLVFYILANLARGFMIGVLWPLVNCVSGSDVTRTTWKEVLVMTWGGLRGAVGLALVLSMRELLMQQGKQETARLMVFFVSGFAALTLLVNATTCSLLLKCLGLTKTPEAQSAILERLRHELFVVSRRAFTDSLDCDGRFKAVKEREINHMLEHLNAELDEPHEEWSMKLIGAGRWTLSGLTVSNNINPFAVRPAPEGAEPEKQEEKPEEKPEEKQDKGRTSALGAAPPRRSSIQAWDHHWWWGFEEIKVDREATWTRQTSQERQAGQAAPGSHQEREVFRKLFMSMLRAEYVRLMDVGMLPRRASGAEHLLASVDAADDWAAVRLNVP
ncbi:Sodium/hydrogen exchanger 7 (Na(+)/H(+) exchanger 7) (NHE-7) (Protein SALT OVERLY SENSITIVE 1) [Durusdinium trenchii]|uniref:Sodium/hydrogen exchanger 7 (Na(+)/H(+) exchanger 7) (NHE-7) (Protein SALT OVERLY SENSITIVE 1) n=1 Tax=Durusdinium trenchii TaxID=1381693 RepID=A0ABP0HH35_9DINO